MFSARAATLAGRYNEAPVSTNPGPGTYDTRNYRVTKKSSAPSYSLAGRI